MLPFSPPFELAIGLDRSDRKVDLFLIEPATGRSSTAQVSTAPEALQKWLSELRERYPEARIAICLEQPAPNLIVFFEAYEFVHLYPINPMTLKRFREAFVVSRANDDCKDAEYLARLLVSHHQQLPLWRPQDSQTRLLQQLVAHRRAVVDERTALTNRLKALLKQYFPQALELCGDELWRPLAISFLMKWPTLQAVKKARSQTIREFYYLQGSRSQKRVDARMELIAKAVPLSDDLAVLASFTLRVQTLLRQLRCVSDAIVQFEKQIAEVFAQHPDCAIFQSLPGAGPTLAPRLLVALGSDRERFPKASGIQHYSGIAPVTKQSGGKRHIHRRYICSQFLRQSFHEYAKESIRHSAWASAYYQQQRAKGAKHNAAVRALAFKWQRIIWRLWQAGPLTRKQLITPHSLAPLHRSPPSFHPLHMTSKSRLRITQKKLLSDHLRGKLSDRRQPVRCSAWLGALGDR